MTSRSANVSSEDSPDDTSVFDNDVTIPRKNRSDRSLSAGHSTGQKSKSTGCNNYHSKHRRQRSGEISNDRSESARKPGLISSPSKKQQSISPQKISPEYRNSRHNSNNSATSVSLSNKTSPAKSSPQKQPVTKNGSQLCEDETRRRLHLSDQTSMSGVVSDIVVDNQIHTNSVKIHSAKNQVPHNVEAVSCDATKICDTGQSGKTADKTSVDKTERLPDKTGSLNEECGSSELNEIPKPGTKLFFSAFFNLS